MRRTGSAGFTLVEVMVAVLLSASVALLAHRLFGAAVDAGGRLREGRLALDSRANAGQFLRSAFLSLEIGTEGAEGFAGARGRVRFSTWLPTADGWIERRTVELRRDGNRWIAAAPAGAPIELAAGVTDLQFDYLLEPGAESRWVSAWESAVSAPLAVRVRVTGAEGADTMIYLVKARG